MFSSRNDIRISSDEFSLAVPSNATPNATSAVPAVTPVPTVSSPRLASIDDSQSTPAAQDTHEIKSDKDTDSISSLSLVFDWLECPLFAHGMMDTSPESRADSSPIHTGDGRSDSWTLLRQLTDAPNGMGSAQTLVSVMKSLVAQDRGSEAGPNHAVHATCAALLWHEGLAGEAVDIVKGALQGRDVSPSPQFLEVWKRGQAMRAVFPEDRAGVALSPCDSIGADGDDESLLTPIKFRKQHSLPVQENMLKPATLAAVRRARLLLSYSPAIPVVTMHNASERGGHEREIDDFEATFLSSALLNQKLSSPPPPPNSKLGSRVASISDCVLSFIQFGPSPDFVRRVAAERNSAALSRTRGFGAAILLLNAATSITAKSDILASLAQAVASISSFAPPRQEESTDAAPQAAGGKAASSMKKPNVHVDPAQFQFHGNHPTLFLQGCRREMIALVEAKWIELVSLIVTDGKEWCTKLDSKYARRDVQHTHVDFALESALVSALAVVGIDFRPSDLGSIISSDLLDFLSLAASSLSFTVRQLALGVLERVGHTGCEALQNPHIIPTGKRRENIKQIIAAVMTVFEVKLQLATTIYANNEFSTDLSTFESFPVLWLLRGTAILDPCEEGVTVYAPLSTSVSKQVNLFSDVCFCDHSLSLWLWKPVLCRDGTVLSRPVGSVSPWSYFSLRLVNDRVVLLMGNKAGIEKGGEVEVGRGGDTTKESEYGLNPAVFDGVIMTSKSSLPCSRWVHISYAVDVRASAVYLCVNGEVVSHSVLPRAMCTAEFPFPEFLEASSLLSTASGSQPSSANSADGSGGIVTQPFVVGQVSTPFATIGRAAPCGVANICIINKPLMVEELDRLALATAPTAKRQPLQSSSPSSATADVLVQASEHGEQLKFQFIEKATSRGILCSNLSSETKNAWRRLPSTIKRSVAIVTIVDLGPQSCTDLALRIDLMVQDPQKAAPRNGEKSAFSHNESPSASTSVELTNAIEASSGSLRGAISVIGGDNNVSNDVTSSASPDIDFSTDRPPEAAARRQPPVLIPPLAQGDIITVSLDVTANEVTFAIEACGATAKNTYTVPLPQLATAAAEATRAGGTAVLDQPIAYFGLSLGAGQQLLLHHPMSVTGDEVLESEIFQEGVPGGGTQTLTFAPSARLRFSFSEETPVEDLGQVLTAWDPEVSDRCRLQLSAGDSTVYFPGLTSSEESSATVPLVAARMTRPRMAFTIMIGQNVMLDGILSVGLARVLNETICGSAAMTASAVSRFFAKKSGFGMQKDSWGIFDDRKGKL